MIPLEKRKKNMHNSCLAIKLGGDGGENCNVLIFIVFAIMDQNESQC